MIFYFFTVSFVEELAGTDTLVLTATLSLGVDPFE